VEVDAIPNEDVDDSGVEGEAKPTQKEVLEDDHLVFPGLRVDVRLQWNPPEARRENSSLFHVFEHGQCHLLSPKKVVGGALLFFGAMTGSGKFAVALAKRKELVRDEETQRQKEIRVHRRRAMGAYPPAPSYPHLYRREGGRAKSVLPFQDLRSMSARGRVMSEFRIKCLVLRVEGKSQFLLR